MTQDHLDLLDTLRDADAGSVMRRLLEHGLQALIEAEAAAVIGAGPRERTEARMTWRNGSRPRTLTTAAGDRQVSIPKTRTGRFFLLRSSRVGASTGPCKQPIMGSCNLPEHRLTL